MQLTVFRNHEVTRVKNDISDAIVSGEPVQHSELKYAGHDNKVRSGIWESTAGIFRADYEGIVEFCHVLEGSARIKTGDGEETVVSAGDAFVLDAGLKTEWHVESFIKKHFMICAL